MAPDPVIEVEHVTKKFRLYRGGGRTLKSAFLDCRAWRYAPGWP